MSGSRGRTHPNTLTALDTRLPEAPEAPRRKSDSIPARPLAAQISIIRNWTVTGPGLPATRWSESRGHGRRDWASMSFRLNTTA